MAAISASMVKELRERTALGMMECKKALTEAGGDIELAIENLRKNSGLKAAIKLAAWPLKAPSSSRSPTTPATA